MKKAQDYIGRYLPEHKPEPDYKETGKCYYCGKIVDTEDLIEHKGVRICKECKKESES